MIDLNKPYCVYVTEHPTGKYYIGKAKTDNIIYEGYCGSGNRLHNMFKLDGHSIDTWTTRIIETFEIEDDAYNYEHELVTLETMQDQNCLNDRLGGREGGFLSSVVEKTNHSIAAIESNIFVRKFNIHTDAQGRYSLNDIHKAAGGSAKDQPSNWYRGLGTKRYIKHQFAKTFGYGSSEMMSGVQILTAPFIVINGNNGGSYGNEYLALDYAAWISPEFKDEVYDAYMDSQAQKQIESQQQILSLNQQLYQIDQQKKEEPTLKSKIEVKMMVAELFNIDKSKLAKDCARTVKRETGVNVDWLLRQL